MRPTVLRCPCGGERSDRVHPVSISVNRGGEVTTVTAHGTRITNAAPSGRGVGVQITLDSEDGHRFALSLQFHKGATIFALTPHDNSEAMRTRRSPFLATIWRD